MSIYVYLNFNGNCREAISYYAEVFGAEMPKIMTFSEMPEDPNFILPEEAKNMVMHARLDILGSYIMFSDVFPNMPFTVGNNVSLSIVTDDRDAIESAYNRLKEGGNIGMELQETFWSPLYGMLEDKYGIHWQFNLGTSEY